MKVSTPTSCVCVCDGVLLTDRCTPEFTVNTTQKYASCLTLSRRRKGKRGIHDTHSLGPFDSLTETLSHFVSLRARKRERDSVFLHRRMFQLCVP